MAAKVEFPTPNARDWKDAGGGTQGNRKWPNWGTIAAQSSPATGRLNPEWVEWLMGWPIGWTDLKPLATDRFREWRQQHGDC
jgi:hypothetical protein